MWPPRCGPRSCAVAPTTSSPTKASTSRLAARGILYCPDYVVNAGGVIQVADERHGFDFERAKAKAGGIYDTLLEVVELAEADGITPNTAADRLAERRMDAVAPDERIWIGR